MSKSKAKDENFTVRDLLFGDHTALVAHSAQALETLLSQFSSACSDLGVTISLKITKVLSQVTDTPPSIKINGKDIENVKNCVYLGSSIVSRVLLDTEINCSIGKLQALSLD